MRAFVAILAFLLGLGLGCTLLRVGPRAKPSTTGGAFEHVVANRTKYEMLVIGSSTVQVNFVSDQFNKEMAKRGHPIVSFGFGRSGMHGPEIDYYLEKLLELDMPKLKWVVIDVSLNQFRQLEKDNWYKRRVIEWHAPAQVAFEQRLIFEKRKTVMEKVDWLWPHVAHGLLRAANVGAGVEGLETGSLFRMRPSEKVKGRGSFQPRPWVESRQTKKAEQYRKGKKAHERGVKRLAKLRKKKQKYANNEYPDRFRDRIEARGLRAAFIIGPVIRDMRINPKIKGERDLLIFDFNDPDKYPDLYKVEHRYDPMHMTWKGAQVYTHALVERFAAVLDAEQKDGGTR